MARPLSDGLAMRVPQFQRRPPRIDLLAACLAAGIERQGPYRRIAEMLSAPTMDYERFAGLAGRHLVTPMLGGCLTEPDLRPRAPVDFVRYLDVMYEQNRLRNADLRRQLAEIAGRLNQIDIEPLLLKGAIRLVDGLYPSLGWRFMRDLDLLVAPERLTDAVACLQALGYRFTESLPDWPEHHRHLPPLYREGEGAVVELHTELLSRHRELCPAKTARAGSTPVDLDGVTVRIPKTADQLAHLLGHDLSDGFLRRSAMLRLGSLFEIALLCRCTSALADVLARCEEKDVSAGARRVLGLAARFFPDQIGTLPGNTIGTRLRIHGLSALERLDENGRWRRFVWFARLRCSKLLRLPAERRHMASQLLSTDYYHRCSSRFRRLWISD